jgi:hypothetical protein
MIRGRNYFTRNILHRHFNQAIHDSFDVARLAPDSKLVIGRSAAFKDGVDVSDLFSRAQVVNNIVNKLQ